MKEKINWKWKYEELDKVYCAEHDAFKKTLFLLKETTNVFEEYLNKSVFFYIVSLIMGLLLGLVLGGLF